MMHIIQTKFIDNCFGLLQAMRNKYENAPLNYIRFKVKKAKLPISYESNISNKRKESTRVIGIGDEIAKYWHRFR